MVPGRSAKPLLLTLLTNPLSHVEIWINLYFNTFQHMISTHFNKFQHDSISTTTTTTTTTVLWWSGVRYLSSSSSSTSTSSTPAFNTFQHVSTNFNTYQHISTDFNKFQHDLKAGLFNTGFIEVMSSNWRTFLVLNWHEKVVSQINQEFWKSVRRK